VGGGICTTLRLVGLLEDGFELLGTHDEGTEDVGLEDAGGRVAPDL